MPVDFQPERKLDFQPLDFQPATASDAPIAQAVVEPPPETISGPLINEFGQVIGEQPLIELAPNTKKALGVGLISALAGPIGTAAAIATKRGSAIAQGVGEAVGGLLEGATTPSGAATIAATVMRPAEALPVLTALGAKQGSEELATGLAKGDLTEAARGATTLGVSVAPLAIPLARGAKAEPVRAAPLVPSTEPFLPTLLPHDVAKTTFSKPFGAANIPLLGRLVDPNARTSAGPLPEALAAYNAEKYGIAPAAAGGVGLRLRALGIDKAFPVDPTTGELTTVRPSMPGQSLAPSDVLESLQRDPNSYLLTPEQRAAFSTLEQWRSEIKAAEKEHGISPAEASPDDPGYFPRIVIKRPEADVAPLGGGSRVGAKQFFQKERMFETEREGVQRGYSYEPSIVSRAASRTERLYRAIADRRLAEDTTLGSRTRAQVESELREHYAEEIGSGLMTEEKLQQIVSSVEHKGSVWGHPAFAGKIFDPETANALNAAFPKADTAFRHHFVQLNNTLKAMRLSADVGVTLIQGLPTLFRNPGIWAKATANSFRALVDPGVLARYAEQNAGAINELSQLGSSTGRLPEMLAGLEKGTLLERAPVIGTPFRAFGRHFETFLDVAKVELWKAWRDVTPADQRLSVARSIESQLSMGRMESIAVSRNRALAERALFLAPSYYRGAVNLIGAIGERGVSGQVARQALGAYIAGGTAAFISVAAALGMDDNEIVARLNPAHHAYMMWEVTVAGKRLNIGFGGIHRSLLRLAASAVKTSIEHPENWKSLTPDKNPFVRWYRGHAATVPGLTWDAITGKDFLGQQTDITTLGQSVIPLGAQPFIRSPEETQAAEAAASMIGLSTFPETGKRKR